MANRLKMATVSTIGTLKRQGWSQRRISRFLGIDRRTVKRHLDKIPDDSNATTNAPTGSVAEELGEDQEVKRSGPVSQCESFRQVITDKLKKDLSAQRIYQDLVTEQGFSGSYYSVRRFIKRLGTSHALPFRRMESLPAEEAQVDFGTGAPVVMEAGKRKKSHVFRVVLSCSRKGYSEAVFRQTTENFIRALENSFWHFGGAPKTLVIDNLKAAVSRADWYDPDLNPKIQSFCEHYGTVILPTKPYTPRHKGKVERGIDYVKNNALKGNTFTSLGAQNNHLLDWETHVADTRIHGTTRRQVGKVFREEEKEHLLPLPPNRFGSFEEAKRSVHRDAHVEVAKAYYSVPPEYMGRQVWARWDGHLVRIFNSRMEQIALHVQVEAGKFQTQSEHIHSRKRSHVERGTVWLLQRIGFIGSQAEQWAREVLKVRGVQGVRSLVGLLSMANKHSYQQVEAACEIARTHNAIRLRTLRQLIKRSGPKQELLPFIDEHPIIRPMSDYGDLVKKAFDKSD